MYDEYDGGGFCISDLFHNRFKANTDYFELRGHFEAEGEPAI